mmetsp:Transcript_27552/g.62531  ORF Transcript_27552/g.62531 Transcript_27552/m.62531 type:complete len:231 (-) Transcript_27552:56-748(-)
MSSIRVSLAACGYQSKIYAMGGHDGIAIMNTCESLSVSETGIVERWRPEPSMMTERCSFGAAVCQDRIYAVGGCSREALLDSCEIFDLAKGMWVSGPKLLQGRYCHAVAVVPETSRIYAVGGLGSHVVKKWDEMQGGYYSSLEPDQGMLFDVESLDPREGKWRREAPMKTGRYLHACAGSGSFLYAVGGCDFAGYSSQAVEVFDTRMGRWHDVIPMQYNKTWLSAIALQI